MSPRTMILLWPALVLALGQNYPTNVTFQNFTSPQGELIKLKSGDKTEGTYRVTALSRLDLNQPGFILEPFNDSGTPVRTYDRKIRLSSRRETPVRIYYQPTQVAYLKINYTHSGLEKTYMFWDNKKIYISYGSPGHNPLWGILWVLTFGLITLFWIPIEGEFNTTIPIPLDNRVHVLDFGGGGWCLSHTDWHGYYKVDSRILQAGKIYLVRARNNCGWLQIDIHGSLKQIDNKNREFVIPIAWNAGAAASIYNLPLNGTVTRRTVTWTDDQGRPVSTDVYEANPSN